VYQLYQKNRRLQKDLNLQDFQDVLQQWKQIVVRQLVQILEINIQEQILD